MMLQGRLANASIGFKDVLEIRTQNMKASRERGQVFGGESSAPNGSHGPASGESASYNNSYTEAEQSSALGNLFQILLCI